MKLLDLLAKLGILRFGAKAAVYRTGADRPPEFLHDGVFNAERDMMTRKDVKEITDTILGRKHPATCESCGTVIPDEAKFCPGCGKASEPPAKG